MTEMIKKKNKTTQLIKKENKWHHKQLNSVKIICSLPE